MAATDPQGEMQFWFNGAPFSGINKTGNYGGEMQFWFNGFPYVAVFPTPQNQNPEPIMFVYQPILAQ